MRWVRRPLLPAMRLWRRNIQLRVVATTLLMSLGVVLLLGFVVIGQVRNGLLDAKVQGRAEPGRRRVRGGQAEGRRAPATAAEDDGATGGRRHRQDVSDWMTDLVEQLASGGQGAFDVVALSADSDERRLRRRPRAACLRRRGPDGASRRACGERIDQSTGTFQSYTRIKYNNGSGRPRAGAGHRQAAQRHQRQPVPALLPLPAHARRRSRSSLVKGTLATAGLFVVVLLGAIAWLVVRQVVTPVRMAAGIAERLSAGRLQERMKVTGEDDIARLGEAFNKMAQNLQLKIQQLEELSRMQRRFVSDVSHELRTPLTTVRMAADVIHDARDDFDPVTARSAELLARTSSTASSRCSPTCWRSAGSTRARRRWRPSRSTCARSCGG